MNRLQQIREALERIPPQQADVRTMDIDYLLSLIDRLAYAAKGLRDYSVDSGNYHPEIVSELNSVLEELEA